jgi:hypothetical protein
MRTTYIGGFLHGTWLVPDALNPSDRRLKKDIRPLGRTIKELLATQFQNEQAGSNGEAQASDGGGAMWLLRQLRPVSYSFKKGAESKHMRFGFIADELETVVPQVVRHLNYADYPDMKTVMYQDLIALLTAAAQGQQDVLEKQKQLMDTLVGKIQAMKLQIKGLKEEEANSDRPRKVRRKKNKAKKKTTNSTMKRR